MVKTYLKFKNNALLGAQIWWQQAWQPRGQNQWQWKWRWQSAGQHGWKKPTGAKVMATSVAKNTGKYAAGVKARAANSMAKIWVASKSPWQHTWQRKGKLALRAKAIATQVAKLWQKIVARAKGWTCKWAITGKSRWHIAWPHDIVCSRWLAHVAYEIVSYAKQVNMFNQMVVVSHDQT